MAIIAPRMKTISLFRIDGNPANNLKSGETGVPSVGYNHGDIFTFSNPLLGSKSVSQRAFLGGSGGYIESLSNGASTTNDSVWEFFYSGAGNPWVGYNDPQRGKVLYNDYAGQIDAIISAAMSAPVPQNTEVYWSFKVFPSIFDSNGDPIPNTGSRQWKIGRGLQSDKTIQDSVNTNIEQFTAVQYGGAGLTTRMENAAGVATGTITSATSNTLNATGASMTPNVYEDFLVEITKTSDGSKQYARCLSNTATQIVLQTNITTPIAGDTFSVGQDASQKYGDSSNLPVLNTGWILVEGVTRTGTQGQADGSFFLTTDQAGVRAVINKTGVPIYGGVKRGNYLPMCQGWIGNSNIAIATKNIKADDVTFQIGSTKRIYITNNPVFSAATIKEFQYETSWSGGVVPFPVNRGGISTAGEYHVVAVEGLDTVIATTTIELTGV